LRAERGALESTLERVRRSKHSLPPALRSNQLCFMHIGKTAGTSLHHMLLEAMPDADVYHASVVDFDSLDDGSLASFDLVMGHFTFRHVPKFRDDRYLTTFLRDPIERVVSTYHFLKAWSGHDDNTSSEALRGAKSLSLRDFLLNEDPAIRMFTSNHQTNVIAQDYRPGFVSGPDALGIARANLDRFWFVGFVEEFNKSVLLLSDKLGLRDPIPPKRLNVTRERVDYGRPQPEEIEIITDLNQLDIELYRVARLDFERKYASASDAGLDRSAQLPRGLARSPRRA
jgi:hypothetical protein